MNFETATCKQGNSLAEKSHEDHTFFENLYRGFVQVGVEDSVNAVVQTINHLDICLDLPSIDIVEEPDEDSVGRTCGELLGLAGKIVGVSAALGVTGVAAPVALGTLTGVGYTFLTPEKEGDKFWQNKIKNATINAATFGIMSGVAQALETFPALSVTQQTSLKSMIARRVAVGIGSGAVAGGADAELEAVLHHDRLATAGELAYSVGRLAAFGSVAGLSEFAAKDLKFPRVVPN